MTTEPSGIRAKLHEIIFEADTTEGKAFDIALMIAIILSVIAVLLESVAGVRARYGTWLRAFEWLMTILFTIEYCLRLFCVGKPLRYARSFYGIVDFMAIIPTYLSAFVIGAQSLIVIRALRLLRVFRVLKLVHFVGEARDRGCADLPHRGRGTWIHQHPRVDLLGNRYYDYCGVRRYRSANSSRQVPGGGDHDSRLRYHRCAHRHRHR